MRKNDNLVTAILGVLIIGIFAVTVYFCLDIFGIIEVPKQYSLTNFFSTQITDLSMATPIEEIINKENIDEWINSGTEQIIVNDNSNTIVQNTDVSKNPNTNNQGNLGSEGKSSNVVNRMYYSQLDIYGRMIYDEINSHRDELKTGTYVANFDTKFNDLLHEENGAEILEEAFQLSINAFLFDNPEIFYIDVTKMYMSTVVTSFGPLKTYRVEIGPLEGENYFYEYFANATSVEIAINEFEKVKNEIEAGLYGELYYKIKSVHDYIIANTEYDKTVSKSNIYTAYGALIGHNAVCEGYAKAFKCILDKLGVPCVIVCGIGQNSNGETESHAWNYVKIDDVWYAVDCTWDDPVIIGNGYVSQDVYSRYFLKGSREFFVDHFEDGNIVNNSNFIYPTISEENYR